MAKKERNIVAMTPEQQKSEIKRAKSEDELNALWVELSEVGYASGGMTHREVLIKRAELRGEEPPQFDEPAGTNLPPIQGGVTG